jgi:hypothetical protein
MSVCLVVHPPVRYYVIATSSVSDSSRNIEVEITTILNNNFLIKNEYFVESDVYLFVCSSFRTVLRKPDLQRFGLHYEKISVKNINS